MSAFVKEFDGFAEAIVTNAIVTSPVEVGENQPFPKYFYTDNAAWDTGAQFSFVSPRVVNELGLVALGKGEYMGIGGDQVSDIYTVHIGLPNGRLICNVDVYCTDLDDYDILLGMDIITETDFLITNKGNKTVFSFRSPSEGGAVLQ